MSYITGENITTRQGLESEYMYIHEHMYKQNVLNLIQYNCTVQYSRCNDNFGAKTRAMLAQFNKDYLSDIILIFGML